MLYIAIIMMIINIKSVFGCEYFMVQVGLLNVDGFYNSLLCFIDKAVDEGFISPKARRIIVSAPTAKQLVRELEVRVHCSSSLFEI